jgi:hypothetical protein
VPLPVHNGITADQSGKCHKPVFGGFVGLFRSTARRPHWPTSMDHIPQTERDDEGWSRVQIAVRTRLWRRFQDKAREARRDPREHAAVLIERYASRTDKPPAAA